MRHGLVAPLLAILGGVAWASCFGESPFVLAPWVVLAPWFLLFGHPRAWLLGLLHGLAYWLASLYWIVPTLESYGGQAGWLAIVLLFGLAVYLALYHAVFAGLGSRLWRQGAASALLGLPALWVALEWLRTYLFGGFPWNLAAYAWVDVAGALPTSAWIGAYGVSFLLVSANTGVALAVRDRRWRLGTAVLGACLALLLMGGRWGVGDDPTSEVSGRPRGVRILQPNTPNLTEWDAELIGANYARLLEQSLAACDVPGSLVVWPESASWPYAWDRHERLRQDVAQLARLGCPVLLNSTMLSDDEEGSFNSALLVDDRGLIDRYDKRHLVPYGEYVPLADWLPFLDKLARNAGSYLTGDRLELLSWGEDEIGVAICFEIVFPGEVAEQVAAGATVLATITNDAWYGDTSAPWQHYRAARFRAAENRRYLVRAAVTGVSGLIAPDGSIVGQLGVGEEGILRGLVRGRADRSPFSRAPWLIPLVSCLVAVSAIFRSLSRRPRSGSSRGKDAS